MESMKLEVLEIKILKKTTMDKPIRYTNNLGLIKDNLMNLWIIYLKQNDYITK